MQASRLGGEFCLCAKRTKVVWFKSQSRVNGDIEVGQIDYLVDGLVFLAHSGGYQVATHISNY